MGNRLSFFFPSSFFFGKGGGRRRREREEESECMYNTNNRWEGFGGFMYDTAVNWVFFRNGID